MALESEYIPEQTSRRSLPRPEDRRVYKKILWGFIGFYIAIIALMGVMVVGNTDVQKAADTVVIGTWNPH